MEINFPGQQRWRGETTPFRKTRPSPGSGKTADPQKNAILSLNLVLSPKNQTVVNLFAEVLLHFDRSAPSSQNRRTSLPSSHQKNINISVAKVNDRLFMPVPPRLAFCLVLQLFRYLTKGEKNFKK